MSKPRILSVLILVLLACVNGRGQMSEYDFKRPLLNVDEAWNKLILPNDMFSAIHSNLVDIRVYGITHDLDTIEAPYILQINQDQEIIKEVKFEIINSSYTADAYYYTFHIQESSFINEISLDFLLSNYDWYVTLEGSQNQQDWFTILTDYRILSIKNTQTHYGYNKLNFPESNYKYYRLRIPTNKKLQPPSSKILLHQISKGLYNDYPIQAVKTTENKDTKKSIIDIDLGRYLPVSDLNIKVESTADYYRPIEVLYLVDSTITEKGWNYQYRRLMTSILSSREAGQMKFISTLTRKIRLVIDNQDNAPLTIQSIKARGYVHELLIRMDQTANYFLVYGRKFDVKPNYDIVNFKDKIPPDLNLLSLGALKEIGKSEILPPQPLFKNKFWLWGILSFIMLLLGWFTIRMIRTV